MKQKNTLILIDHTSSAENLESRINNRESTHTLYIYTKHTKLQDIESATTLCNKLDIPAENQIQINISSIVQKTWRIIKHYSSHEAVPEKNTPDRKKDLQRIAKLNHARLDQLETAITDMVITDQATKIDAKVIYP